MSNDADFTVFYLIVWLRLRHFEVFAAHKNLSNAPIFSNDKMFGFWSIKIIEQFMFTITRAHTANKTNRSWKLINFLSRCQYSAAMQSKVDFIWIEGLKSMRTFESHPGERCKEWNWVEFGQTLFYFRQLRISLSYTKMPWNAFKLIKNWIYEF